MPASSPLVQEQVPTDDPLALILGAAESAVGVPYQWGGNSLATGVDCSGLVQRAFAAAGISLPRVSADQARAGQSVSMDAAQPGDLLWWDNSSRNNGADHIAIYLGNGLMIEAPRRGAQVRVTEVRPGASATRVIGVVPATNPSPVPLGPNADRKFTAAALGVSEGVSVDDPSVVTAAAAGPTEGGFGDDLPDDASEEETLAYIRENLPQWAPLLANDEIRYVLTWAVREDKDDAEIVGAIRRTNYAQTHSATSQDVDLFLGSAGAAEVRRVTDEAKRHVNDLFSKNGITLDDPTLSRLAMQALRAGDISLQGYVVDAQGLNQLVGFGLGQATELPAGETSFNADNLAAISRSEYLLPITQREADSWAVRILNGQASEQQFRAELNRRARERYDWLNLGDGQTVSSRFDGIVATVADTLEIDPDQIDLLDPRWNWMVEKVDPKTGARYSPTLGEAVQMARDLPEFEDTQRYRQQDAGFTRGLIDLIEGRAA